VREEEISIEKVGWPIEIPRYDHPSAGILCGLLITGFNIMVWR